LTETALTLDGDRADGAIPVERRRIRLSPWLGLLPFAAFLFLFLLLPSYGIVEKAFTGDGSPSSFFDVFNDERQAFWGSAKVSLVTAALGVVFGTAIAYAAATATRPRWLRSVVTAFSGVAANMGGVVLAFLFFTLLGRQGLGTKLINEGFDYDLYRADWWGDGISDFWGWVIVYMYFQIPLMVLITLPAVDGLKPAWREASANLGGTSWTYWRRVGLPVLAPSMLGGFLLLFANAFSAYATVYALNNQANVVPVKISFGLSGDVGVRSSQPYALATWMVIVIAIAMGGYLLLRKRAERWQAA
jgi:putative spermidine/putrescine transport system permease protein